MSDPDPISRAAYRLRDGYSDVLMRLMGRYYDPAADVMIAFILAIAVVTAYSAIQGTVDRESIVLGGGSTLLLGGTTAWVLIRQERRWRA